MSLGKTKGMAVGAGLRESDTAPVQVGAGSLETLDNFRYLGVAISRDAEST